MEHFWHPYDLGLISGKIELKSGRDRPDLSTTNRVQCETGIEGGRHPAEVGPKSVRDR